MDTTTVFIFLLTFLLVVIYRKSKQTCDVPGPRSLPLIGTFLSLMKYSKEDRDKMFESLNAEYGNIFRISFGPFPVVFVCGYDLINEWFEKKGSLLVDRPNWIPGVKRFETNGHLGIIWSNGERWKTIRRFTMQTLRDMGVGKTTIEERILEEVKFVMQYLESSEGNPTCLRRKMSVATSNIIHSVVFGFRYSFEDEKFQKLLDHIDALFSTNTLLSMEGFLPWLRYFKGRVNRKIEQHRKELERYIGEQIEEHRRSFDENNIRDFIDLYIASESGANSNYGGIDKNDFFRTILSLFIAGTDTTSSTLYWSFLYMIAYPDVQQKCQKEIDQYVGSGRMVQLSDRKNLKYTEATLMEVQMCSNVAPTTLPHMPIKDIQINGYTIPKGTIVLGLLRSAHMDNNYWEKPELFNPNRFLDDEGKIKNKELFMPFSLGPRIFPGESLAKSEMFLIFVNILHRFDLEKTEDKLNLKGMAGLTTMPYPYELKANLRQ